MMLQEVLQSALDGHLLTPARVGPMRTAVKQFSAMFGVPPDQLAPTQYHLAKEPLFRFIEQHSPADVGPRKLANTKNNVRWLLDLAVQKGWLVPTDRTALTWSARHRTHERRLYRQRTDSSRVDTSVYTLLRLQELPDTKFRPSQMRQREGLRMAPQALLEQIDAYLSWCQKAYAPDRSAKIQKREVSADGRRKVILRIAGYAHHVAGIPLDEITLERLTQPDFVQGFVDWWVNTRRGRVTSTISGYLKDLGVIAHHWLKQPEHGKAIKAIAESLSTEGGPVYDKESALVPLRSIEEAGLRNYPFSPERLQRAQYLRRLYQHKQNPEHVPMPIYRSNIGSWAKIGTQAMMSLIIRLLVRLPMRQRCIREMRLGHNLRQLPDGNWEVYFSGKQLKIASRKHTGVNVYHHAIPAELTGLINEWLTFWRPRRVPAQGSDLVFLSQEGQQFTPSAIDPLFIRAIYRITGIRTTIHMVRDSWASDYLDATGDVAGCADMLGDTVQMVLRHYAHILKRRAQERTATWLQTHLGSAG